GKKIGTIVELACCREDTVFRVLRNRVGYGRTVDNQRNGGRRQPEIIRQFLEADRLAQHAPRAILASLSSLHWHAAQSRITKFAWQASRATEIREGKTLARAAHYCDKIARAITCITIMPLTSHFCLITGCGIGLVLRSEEHTSELQSPDHLVCRLLLEKKKIIKKSYLSWM